VCFADTNVLNRKKGFAMVITKTSDGDALRLTIDGRIDTLTSPQLAGEIEKVSGESFATLVLDFHAVEYISSAGLRVE
jgi:anti-sigma B factor antagonist